MFKKSFSFNGRIGRAEYLLSFVFYVILSLIIQAILKPYAWNSSFGLIALAYIPMLWFLAAQSAKRCHDIGQSGWMQLIPFYILYIIFPEGDVKANKYGENTQGVKDAIA